MWDLTFRQRCTSRDRCQRKTEQCSTKGTTPKWNKKLFSIFDGRWKNIVAVTWIFSDEDVLASERSCSTWSFFWILYYRSSLFQSLEEELHAWRLYWHHSTRRISETEELFDQSCEMDQRSWDSTCLEWWRKDLWTLRGRISSWLEDSKTIFEFYGCFWHNTFSRQKQDQSTQLYNHTTTLYRNCLKETDVRMSWISCGRTLGMPIRSEIQSCCRLQKDCGYRIYQFGSIETKRCTIWWPDKFNETVPWNWRDFSGRDQVYWRVFTIPIQLQVRSVSTGTPNNLISGEHWQRQCWTILWTDHLQTCIIQFSHTKLTINLCFLCVKWRHLVEFLPSIFDVL